MYAIGATLELAQRGPNRPVSGAILAAERGIPKRFLLQILRQLVNAGVLRSIRGAGGGYTLDRPPEQISLLDIFEAIEKPTPPPLPVDTLRPATRELLMAFVKSSELAHRGELRKRTLAELLLAESDYRAPLPPILLHLLQIPAASTQHPAAS